MNEISSIIRATEILKCLTIGDHQLSLIARKLRYNKATVYRVLKTLEKVGLAIQDPITLLYYPGPMLSTLTNNFQNVHQVLNVIALKHMEALRDAIVELVTLQVPMGTQRIIIEVAQVDRDFGFIRQRGSMSPIYTGAAGRVLLSKYADMELKLMLDSMELKPITEKTTVNKNLLLQQIKRVRLQGYAIESNEISLGITAISVPVENYSCPIALTIAGMENNIKKNAEKLLKSLLKTSKIISDKLLMTSNKFNNG